MLINRKLTFILAVAALLTGYTNHAITGGRQGPLHVPSPEWQDQIIYFLMIDRFNDGDKKNNDQGAGVYEPGAKSKYNGGDLQGVINKLDYIQDLGATAVWTTPQVANQWWDPVVEYWGYHGYWARDFKSVDEHYGTLKDYQNLARDLHSRNMYLIQDIVVNHTGNFFYYDGKYDENDVTKNFKLNTGSLPTVKATQIPFNLNDVNNKQHKLSSIFNWTPEIQDVSVLKQENTFQLADLDDMNTDNPVVRDALKESYGYWIKQAGVDAFRIDTAKYVEKEFYEDFLHSENGITKIAESTGRSDFLTFGEILEMSPAFSSNAEKKISTYLGTKDKPRIDAPIGFPLYSDIQNVFAGGRPTSYLSYRLNAALKWYKDPYKAVNFIDNHDVERFLADGTLRGFKQAYAFLMTVPGIPAIYQGDEQAHALSRQAMFAGGYGSSQDQFDKGSEMYRFIRKLAKMRLKDRLFSRGNIEFLQVNEYGPGILAYKREYQGREAYIILNSANNTALLNRLPTSFWGDNEPNILLTENIDANNISLKTDGTLTMVMPARSILIFSGKSQANLLLKEVIPEIKINPIPSEFNNVQSTNITGTTSLPNAELLRIIDGNMKLAERFYSDNKGAWSTELPVNGLGSHRHSVEIFWPQKNLVSEKHDYKVTYTLVSSMASKKDVIGDDKGIKGTYIKPAYQENKCYMDIESVTIKSGGDNMELTLKMCDISTAWAPPNGFDHLALTTYLDLKSDNGKKALPLINANMPRSKNWDLAHTAFGWGSYMFSSDHSSANQEGALLNYTPEITVNNELKEIRIMYEGRRLGISNWQDTSVYITTWDKDEGGDYRNIYSTPSKWNFSHKNPNAPRIADDIFLTLRSN